MGLNPSSPWHWIRNSPDPRPDGQQVRQFLGTFWSAQELVVAYAVAFFTTAGTAVAFLSSTTGATVAFLSSETGATVAAAVGAASTGATAATGALPASTTLNSEVSTTVAVTPETRTISALLDLDSSGCATELTAL